MGDYHTSISLHAWTVFWMNVASIANAAPQLMKKMTASMQRLPQDDFAWLSPTGCGSTRRAWHRFYRFRCATYMYALVLLRLRGHLVLYILRLPTFI
jgi:hypothetical protein